MTASGCALDGPTSQGSRHEPTSLQAGHHTHPRGGGCPSYVTLLLDLSFFRETEIKQRPLFTTSQLEA